MDEKYCALLAAIEKGSLSGAAEDLGYTPSGVSKMIASLESVYGLTLLRRGKNGVQPTAECGQMLPAIRSMIYYAERCEQIAAEIRGMHTGCVTIGTSYNAYNQWISEIVASFSRRYPGIEIRMLHRNSTELSEAILDHRADMGIVSHRSYNGLDWIPIREDPMVAWVPAGSPFVDKGYVPAEAFSEVPYIQPYPGEDTDGARYLRCHGIKANVKYTVEDIYGARCLVGAGLGITLMNRLTGEDPGRGVTVLPIRPEEIVAIGVIMPKDEELSPAARELVRYVREKVAGGMPQDAADGVWDADQQENRE
ncbi:MAG: LysR family transcriptional regulator [Eubacteriales bacterium]|jgi:DNA-binding transcriptional LysR family regulator|nr:LysR family transcriptional regulator [Eubacteriales bacterium]